jgi:pilus assembly protein CpaF
MIERQRALRCAGLGGLEDFLRDSSITEILIRLGSIFIEKAGKISKTNVSLPDEKRLKSVIDRIVSQKSAGAY